MHFLDARFLAYLAIATLLIVIPGPDTALVIRNALLSGRRAASFTTFGIGVGSVVWAGTSVLGVAVLFEHSVIVFTLFKLVGGAYLVYLGLRSLIGSIRKNQPTGPVAPEIPAIKPTHLSDLAAFRQGLLGNLLNPKAGAIFATVFPQFINPGDSPLRLCLMLLAYEAILLIWLNTYGYLISKAGKSRIGIRIRENLSRVTGVVLIALGIRLVLERQ